MAMQLRVSPTAQLEAPCGDVHVPWIPDMKVASAVSRLSGSAALGGLVSLLRPCDLRSGSFAKLSRAGPTPSGHQKHAEASPCLGVEASKSMHVACS